MSDVISSFKSLRAGLQGLALLMLFVCLILHTLWSGKSMQLLCILPFGMLCPVSFLVVCESPSVWLKLLLYALFNLPRR